jgi:acyl-CoA reductase-like NAD-dependent aldehyde dehydrogenase
VTEQSGSARMAGGTQPIPAAERSFPETSREAIDAALDHLVARAPIWTELDVAARIVLLDGLLESTLAAGPAWVEAAAHAKGIHHDSPLMGEDWGSGVVTVLRNLRLLRRTLTDIQATGRPQPPSLHVAPNGQVVATVLPTDRWDALLFPGFSGEVRLQPHITLDQATARIGRIYREGHEPQPGVALVLGAGNVSSIGPMDALYELFAKDHVVLLKMNPVNEHLGPHVAEAFEPLIRAGFLRIVYGGADVGEYLTRHPSVDTVHVTGSDKTHDAIVFGRGEEGARRKAAAEPELTKPITSELGNVTPVIVVPGPWSDKDLAYHGDSIASKLVQNGGFNCVAARVVVQHRAWARRNDLLHAVRASLRRAEERTPYYPGAVERWERFVTEHPTSEWFGEVGPDRVPFTLIPDLDPGAEEDIAFRTEAFCGVFGEVALDTPRSVPEFLERAVEFCNETLWGTLSASILIHPASLRDPDVAAAFERAIDELRYGTVVVNDWSGQAYGFVSPSWGAYPGAELTDIQSGRGVVHNTYLLEDIEKSVIRGPFRPVLKPLWFHTHRTMDQALPAFARFTATEDPRNLPKVLWAAVRG